MAAGAVYCDENDLLLDKNFPLPSGISKVQYIQSAAREMDTKIGRVYQVPIQFSTTMSQNEYSATVELLKWINMALATGRLIMAMAMTSENTMVHAYAKSLVEQACSYLDQILEGSIVLDGANRKTETGESSGTVHGSLFNQDPHSRVEAFQEFVTSDTYRVGPLWPGTLG